MRCERDANLAQLASREKRVRVLNLAGKDFVTHHHQRATAFSHRLQLLARSASAVLSQAAPTSGNGVNAKCLRRAGALDVGCRRLDKFFQPALEPGFDLPHALAADTKARADFLQRLGIFRQQPRLENLELLVLQRRRELLDLVVGEVAPFAVRRFGLGIVPRIGDNVEQARIVVVAGTRRLVERDFALRPSAPASRALRSLERPSDARAAAVAA